MKIEVTCSYGELREGKVLEVMDDSDLSFYTVRYKGKAFGIPRCCCGRPGEIRRVKVFKEGTSNKKISKYRAPNDYSTKVERMFI